MDWVERTGDWGQAEERSREIRIALVLYGGVSLAVYENGVTRAFFDLVKGKGVFDLILKLLDSTAVVDVVAGTSAGGINGLLLATALEAGSDFAGTADLWRKHGDIGALMRPVSKAGEAQSLLDGEGYYQDRLEEAFRKLLEEGVPGEGSTGEMDVFITGTDLAGHVNTCWDTLGQKIEDKSHRVVFQLKHRPGRRLLGLSSEEGIDLTSPEKSTPDEKKRIAEKQATILASIARITSTFPAAFPPFRLSQIASEHRKDVRSALESCGGLQDIRQVHHVYVDGGVLNNKPFGPVIRAIFYRVPYGLVDRRLFYVEPDPEHITQLTKEKEEKLVNPVGTVVATLTTIPSHQSIFEDLDRLKEHNALVNWLKGLKAQLAESAPKMPHAAASGEEDAQRAAYRQTRVESIVRSLLFQVEAVPSAKDYIAASDQKALYEGLKAELAKISLDKEGMAAINNSDIDYHLRRSFHILYWIHRRLEEGGGDAEKTKKALRATSRIVKLLKLIRDSLFTLRDRTVPIMAKSGNVTPGDILDVFVRFLAADAPQWRNLTEDLQQELQTVTLGMRDAGPLASHVLSEAVRVVHGQMDEAAAGAAEGRAPGGGDSSGGEVNEGLERFSGLTILEVVEKVLGRVVDEWSGRESSFGGFEAVDQILFPIEFACGIHELDEIELVRISPKEAQKGLSALSAPRKVTGDELAHFAAFFRRDWRSNDILWGRLDGICQIVSSLLDEQALRRLVSQKSVIKGLVSRQYLDSLLPDCPEFARCELENAWMCFVSALEGASESSPEAAFEQLKVKLILAGQHAAVNRDFQGLYEDLFFQEYIWGACCEEKVTTACSSAEVAAAEAKIRAGEMMRETEKENRGEAFKQMAMGDQTVVGENGRIPMKILGEYGSQAYLLLWGMLEAALGGGKRRIKFLGEGKFRAFFRSPALFVYFFLHLMRTEKQIFPYLIGALVVALCASGITGMFLGSYLFVVPFLLSFAIFALYMRLR